MLREIYVKNKLLFNIKIEEIIINNLKFEDFYYSYRKFL